MRIMTSVAAVSASGIAIVSGSWPSAVMADVGVEEIRVPVAAISCRVTPPAAVAPSAEVLGWIDGAYRLSNGQRLDLNSANGRVVADFGRWSAVPLVATASNRFESRDGQVWLRYEADARTERIVVSYPADARGRFVDAC